MENNRTEEPTWHSTYSDLDLSAAKLNHLKRKTDAYIGEIDEFEVEDSKEHLLRKEILVEEEDQLTPESIRKLKGRVHLKHDNLLSIFGFSLESATESPAKLSFFFEPFSTNAGVEFQKNQKNLQYFDDEELTSSLGAVAEALAFLQKHKISHGSVTPSSILMSQEGEVKLLDHSLFAKEHSAYFAALNGSQFPYLAPEVFGLLNQDKNKLTQVNAFKADVFALGMTFLYAALLEEPEDCYNWETNTFDSVKLSSRINRVYKKYPGKFSNLLSHLLLLNPTDRPDAQALLTYFEYYLKVGAVEKTSYYHTPEKFVASRQDYHREVSSSATQYNYVDSRVQEIIREAKEKKWAHGSYSVGRSQTDYTKLSNDRFELLNETKFRYVNPFLEGASESLSNGGFVYKIKTEDSGEGKFDRYSFNHNTREVNEVIADFKNSRTKFAVIERQPDFGLLSARSIDTQVKKSYTDDDKLFRDTNTFKSTTTFVQAGTETPEKKEFILSDFSQTYTSFGATSSSFYYQRKIQSKNEIIQELRSKFGTKSQVSEEKVYVEEQPNGAQLSEEVATN